MTNRWYRDGPFYGVQVSLRTWSVAMKTRTYLEQKRVVACSMLVNRIRMGNALLRRTGRRRRHGRSWLMRWLPGHGRLGALEKIADTHVWESLRMSWMGSWGPGDDGRWGRKRRQQETECPSREQGPLQSILPTWHLLSSTCGHVAAAISDISPCAILFKRSQELHPRTQIISEQLSDYHDPSKFNGAYLIMYGV